MHQCDVIEDFAGEVGLLLLLHDFAFWFSPFQCWHNAQCSKINFIGFGCWWW